MPITGTHSGLDDAPAPPATPGRDGGVAGHVPRRTLSLRVEIRRQLARRRTQLTLGFLVLLPFLLVGAFQLGGEDADDATPSLVDVATEGASNFTLFVLFVSTGFLLVVVFALFAGDTVASEASWSSLRYLLASPVPRSHLLRQKLVVALLFSGVALVALPASAYLAGGLFYGWGPLQTPLGTAMGAGEAAVRILVILGYLALTLVFVSSLAFLIGVFTDAPLGAVGGAVLLVIVSGILNQVDALGDLRGYLPTRYSLAWIDALAPTISWDQMAQGVLWSFTYSLPLLALAWWRFDRKDVVS
jgi:ABC-2 type transport system permease protein